MTSPRRRTIRTTSPLRSVRALLDDRGPEIDLGISHLRAELDAAGWPSRTPDADRRPRTGISAPDDLSGDVLDYADPTGELAMRLDRLHADRETFEDHRHLVETSLRAMHTIALRHMPPAVPAIPACSVTSCGEPVESRVLAGGGLSFVGMTQVAGQWVPKPGVDPVCRRCRARRERGAA